MRLFRTPAAVWVSALAVAATVEAQPVAERRAPVPVTQSVALPLGTLSGTVTDPAGAPLAGVTVAAEGATSATAVTGPDGRYVLAALLPGPYLVRAYRSGYVQSRPDLVSVAPHGRVNRRFILRPLDLPGARATDAAPAVFTAALQPPAAGGAPEEIEPAAPTAVSEEPGEETRWRLRHLRRSVLRSTTAGDLLPRASDEEVPAGPWAAGVWVGRMVEHSARFAAGLFDQVPWSGQINLLTTTSFDRPGELFAPSRWPRGVASLALSAPAGSNGEWTVRGAMTSGDVASWVVAGSYVASVLPRHAISAELSYSTQRYDGGNPAALAAVRAEARNVGTVSLFDSWALTPRVSLDYGGQYAWYDYLERSGLFSPRIGVSLTPIARTHVRVQVSQHMLAPGAEEFLPPETAGPWLPPERTFSPLPGTAGWRPERTRQVEWSLERELTATSLVRVRRVYQRVADQLATVFGLDPLGLPGSDLGHYYVASVGAVAASGWGVGITRRVGDGVRGSVEYHVWQADWRGIESPVAALRWSALGELRDERLHDVTAALEAAVPVLDTQVVLFYRLNSAFSRSEAAGSGRSVDGRFDVQFRQPLPSPAVGGEWEVLLAVRNLFREPQPGASVYDELLVIRPPKRIVGGVLVRF